MLQYFKSKTFLRAFVTFLLLFTFLLAAFWGTLLGILQNSQRQKQVALCEETANKMKLLIDDTLSVTADIAHYLQNASWTHKLMSETKVFEQEFDYSRKQDLTQQLLFYSAAYPAVRHIAVLYPEQHFAVTSQGWFPEEDYFDYAKRSLFMEPGAFKKAVDLRLASGNINHFDFDYQNESYVVNLQNLEHTQTPRAIFICVLSREGIRGSFENGLPSSLSGIAIMSGSGSTVLEYEIRASSDCYLVELDSELLDFRYRLTYQMDSSLSGGVALLLLLFVPCMLLGVTVSFLLAIRSYKPMQKLVNRYSPLSGQAAEMQREYEFLERTFDSLIRENSSLQEKIDWYGGAVRSSLLLQLLQGCFDGEGITEKLRQFHIPFSEEQWFTVLLLRCPEEDRSAVSGLLPVLQEYFSGQREAFENCETVETFENGAAVIFCSQSCLPPGEIAELARDELRQLLQVDFHITCGAPYHGTLGVSKSYQDAKRLHHEGRGALYYPDDWEKQLSVQLKDGNWKLSRNILTELYWENKIRHTKLDANGGFLPAVLDTVARVAAEIGHTLPPDALRAGLSEQSNPWDYVLDAAEDVCRYSCKTSIKQIENLHQKLLEYVRQNYCKSTLSLKDISEKFGLSIVAVSRLFKEAAEKNFHDYVTEMRMEKAKHLLSTINYNVSYITRAVGYESEYSFKRAFLHSVGMKPRQYAEGVLEEAPIANDPSANLTDGENVDESK